MNKKILQIANGLAFVITIIINYLSNTGIMNNTTIGEVAKSYESLISAAAYTFGIWGFIYLLLLGFVIYQGRSLFIEVKDDDFVLKTAWWFVLSCVFNSLWVIAWVYEYTALSCVFILLLLFSLIQIVIKNRMQLDDKPFPVILFLWWPFVIYSGWVTVAAILNITSYLVKINWNGEIDPLIWAIIMLSVAILINLILTWERNMREFAIVGAWALIGIAVKTENHTVMYFCYIGTGILLLSSFIHAYKNRATAPLIKFKEWRNKD